MDTSYERIIHAKFMHKGDGKPAKTTYVLIPYR